MGRERNREKERPAMKCTAINKISVAEMEVNARRNVKIEVPRDYL